MINIQNQKNKEKAYKLITTKRVKYGIYFFFKKMT